MRSSRTAAVFALVLGLLIGGAPVVLAHHIDSMFPTPFTSASCSGGGMGTTFCQTDNATLTVWRESSLTFAGRTNISLTLNDGFFASDLTPTYVTTPSYTGGSETDIIYQQSSAVGSCCGVTWCNDVSSSTKCDQHYVAFGSNTPSVSLACHETGHAVGLTHGQNSNPQISNTSSVLQCMTTPVGYTPLGVHNTGAINATY